MASTFRLIFLRVSPPTLLIERRSKILPSNINPCLGNIEFEHFLFSFLAVISCGMEF